jgi:hypothetical protein
MTLDLNQLAQRLAAAAQRSVGLEVSVSSFDLILSKQGHGTQRSESVPFAAIFLSDRDLLAEALDRLDRA